MSLVGFIVCVLLSLSAIHQCGGTTSLDFSRGFFKAYKLNKIELKTELVSFNFSTELNFPELPSWLHLEQRRSIAPAYLYGAPGILDQSTTLEIIGWEKENYTTNLKLKNVKLSGSAFPYFQAEFFIKNKQLDSFLDAKEYKLIPAIIKNSNYSLPGDLDVTMVISAIGHGGRVPLPKSNNHEGVIVRVGSSQQWDISAWRPGKKPIQDIFYPQYVVDWSRFKWIDLRNMKSPVAERQKSLPHDGLVPTSSYSPPVLDKAKRDFDNDFTLIVVIPMLIILLFVLLLSLIMYCGREGRRKRDRETPTIKLTHHHNIQRSTLRLRELSKPREPVNSHTGSEDHTHIPHVHGNYERIADEDNDRTDGRNAPPPYRIPPGAAGKGQAQSV